MQTIVVDPLLVPAPNDGLLGTYEMILRRSCAVPSRAAALVCVAGEVARVVGLRYAWLEVSPPGSGTARITAVTPQDDATWQLVGATLALPPEIVPSPEHPPIVSIQSQWDEQDAEHAALVRFGIECVVRVSFCGGGQERLAAAFVPTGSASEAGAMLSALAPCIACAVGMERGGTSMGPAPNWAGVDAVETVDYVCRALAHDVRNIMSGIIGAIELQRATMDQKNVPIFDVVRRRAVEGVAMVDAMRERMGRLAPEMAEAADLAVVARQVVSLCRPAVETAYPGCAPQLTVDGGSAPVLCNPAELRRAVTALLFNAVRAAGRNGRVSVRTGVDRRHSVVQFEDSGSGLPADHSRRAKEPFYTTAEGGHAGLGLTIADGVARSFGGSVSARMTETGGMTAALMLPTADVRDFPA